MKKTELLKLSVGQIGNAMAFMVMFLFMPTYFKTEIFTGHPLENTLSFLIIAISFTAGALTYIFAGYLSDRTRTRWGKRRPFFLAVIPSGIAYILLGIIIPSASLITMFIFLALMATTYAMLYRLEYCSYWSLYMDLTAPEERVTTSITFNLFGTVGTAAALVLTPILEKIFPYHIITLLVGSIFIGSVLFAFFFGPREDLTKFQNDLEQRTLIKTLKETVTDRNFFYYLVGSFFFVLGYSISVLVLIPFLRNQSIDLLIMLPFIVPAVIFYFIFFNRIAKTRGGKLQAFKLALKIGILTIPFTIFLGLAGSGALLFIQIFLILLIILFVVIAILTFQYAILMDLSPKGQEATYSGIYLFVIVIPIPISSSLIGPILDFLTYDFLIWPGASLGFAVIFLITVLFITLSYFFLRKIQIKDLSP